MDAFKKLKNEINAKLKVHVEISTKDLGIFKFNRKNIYDGKFLLFKMSENQYWAWDAKLCCYILEKLTGDPKLQNVKLRNGNFSKMDIMVIEVFINETFGLRDGIETVYDSFKIYQIEKDYTKFYCTEIIFTDSAEQYSGLYLNKTNIDQGD